MNQAFSGDGEGAELIRRYQQRKVDERRARRAAAEGLESGKYRIPNCAELREQAINHLVDDEATIRVQNRFWTDRGSVVNFVLLLQMRDLDGSWRNLSRIDCCHGHSHLHPEDDGPAGESIFRLDDVTDVVKAHKVS